MYLYGKDINLIKNGAKLFFLLNLQDNKKNGWQNTICKQFEKDTTTTFYTLSTLFEYKILLLKRTNFKRIPLKTFTKIQKK